MSDEEKRDAILKWWNEHNPTQEAYAITIEPTEMLYQKMVVSLVSGRTVIVPFMRDGGQSRLDSLYEQIIDHE